MERWPEKKVADGPPLEEAERKQLRYERGRRAWSARSKVETELPLLADKLADDAIVSGLRPAVASLIERTPHADHAGILDDHSDPLHDLCRLAGWDLAGRLAASRD